MRLAETAAADGGRRSLTARRQQQPSWQPQHERELAMTRPASGPCVRCSGEPCGSGGQRSLPRPRLLAAGSQPACQWPRFVSVSLGDWAQGLKQMQLQQGQPASQRQARLPLLPVRQLLLRQPTARQTERGDEGEQAQALQRGRLKAGDTSQARLLLQPTAAPASVSPGPGRTGMSPMLQRLSERAPHTL
jgi:hypothetical protein